MQTHFNGTTIQLSGTLPEIGSQAKDFSLIDTSLKAHSLNEYLGSTCILNIFPSIDTEICATSVQTFSKEVETLQNTKLLCISRDLPFALQRFLQANSIENVIGLSDFRNGSFGEGYGISMESGPLEGLLARCVIVLDETGKTIYTELVEEITAQPKYSSVLKLLS